MTELDRYSSDQVTKALIRLVLDRGDVNVTAEQLIGQDADEPFMVPAEVLHLWKTDTHAEQYKRLERQHGESAERETVAQLRETLRDTSTAKRDMIQRVAKITREELTPSALRALADAEAKAVNSLLALTGRPVDGRQGAGSVNVLVQNLVDRGLVSLAPGVTLSEPKPVPNLADSAPQDKAA